MSGDVASARIVSAAPRFAGGGRLPTVVDGPATVALGSTIVMEAVAVAAAPRPSPMTERCSPRANAGRS